MQCTAQLLAEELGYKRKQIVVDDRLYATDADDLLAIIRSLDKRLSRVMLFGHNPEFTDLAHRPSSEITDMPTCAVIEFDFDTESWSHVGELRPAQSVLDYPTK